MALRNRGLNWLKQHVDHTGSDCLEWPFSKNWDGYGRVVWLGRAANSHRIMCILAHGEAGEKENQAAHRCGNASCVNPAHLYWATPSQNQFDIKRHDRRHRRRLNPESARVVYERTQEGVSQKSIAVEFGISPRMVRLIANRECWATK